MVEFFKSAKGESYFFCLKIIPSDFRGGFISENLGVSPMFFGGFTYVLGVSPMLPKENSRF